MNLYNELELDPTATAEEIKQKFRTLAQIHHPDKGGDEEKFKRIKLAYEVLTDPERRAQYDSTGKIHEGLGIRAESLDQLAQILFNITPNFNYDSDDLILLMSINVNTMKQDLTTNIGICENYLKKLDSVKEKLKLKNENTEDILGGFIKKQIEVRNQEMITFKRRILICNLMLEILEDYYYGFISLQDLSVQN